MDVVAEFSPRLPFVIAGKVTFLSPFRLILLINNGGFRYDERVILHMEKKINQLL